MAGGEERSGKRRKGRIRRYDCLMWEENDSQQELLCIRYDISADREIVRQPRLVAWRAQQRDGEREEPRECDRDPYEAGPPDDRSRRPEPPANEHRQLSEL